MEALIGYILLNILSIYGIIAIIYLLLILGVCGEIIKNTESASKALGHLLLIVFIPLLGIVLYLSFGVNYRNKKMYSKKLSANKQLESEVAGYLQALKNEAMQSDNKSIREYGKLAEFIGSDPIQSVNGNNHVTILSNGENAFPSILEALENAVETIHLEYYIVRNDTIAHKIKDVLIKKAEQGLKVRFIYDDFGSRSIRGRYVNELKAAGVEIYPFRKLIFIALANRLNYRNHRKIIVIDGKIGFVGGMNIGDEYINQQDSLANGNFYRDVHLRIEGYACYTLQHIFLCDWNFCADQDIHPDEKLFPEFINSSKEHIAQIIASGPDSKQSMIMYSILQAIALAKKEVLITTPYFVPSESIMEVLKIAAMSEVSVKILVPFKTNSFITQLASCSYYEKLMATGVEIYRYTRGFIHAKTSVFDGEVAMIGTANMDNRSFNLNFEVNAVIYDENIAGQMVDEFYHDLKGAVRIDPIEWKKRSKATKFIEKTAHLASSLL